MEDVIKEMQELKETISTATIDVATSEGRLSSSLDRLKNEFKQNSLEGAKKVTEANKKKMLSIEQSVVEKFKALQEEYEF